MITINLLPVELRPIKRTPNPHILCVALIIGALLMCFQVYMRDVSTINALSTELSQNEDELNSLLPSVNKYNELYKEKQLLATQLETINEIVSDRVYWSLQLHNLARLSEEKNMWFDKIEVKSRTSTVTKTQVDANGKPTKVRTRVRTPLLSISGFVASGVDGSFSVYDFMEAADSDPEFSAQFVLESTMIDDVEYKGSGTKDGEKVREFTLEYLFAGGGA